jgi:hypothetical protein
MTGYTSADIWYPQLVWHVDAIARQVEDEIEPGSRVDNFPHRHSNAR